MSPAAKFVMQGPEHEVCGALKEEKMARRTVLTSRQRAALFCVPEREVAPAQLIVHTNRLSLALQLCAACLPPVKDRGGVSSQRAAQFDI